jgi:hypothetical protein
MTGLADALRGAAAMGVVRQVGGLRGPALEHAQASLTEALATLRAVAADGWEWLLRTEPPLGRGTAGSLGRPRLTAAGPVPIRDALDPFTVEA